MTVGMWRCNDVAREQAVDPIGTAPSHLGFLLVEWPLPWPRDAAEVAALADVCAAAATARWRVQLVVPPHDDVRRVAAYQRPPGPFRRFEGVEVFVPPADVAEAAGGLLGGGYAGATPVAGQDVLVCTHGRRDRCCGARGAPLAAQFPGRVQRTSHLGGHRFAPTALILPEGSCWAYLDAPTLRRILDRRGEPAALVGNYRGCAGLDLPAAHVGERVGLLRHGWTWLDAWRSVVARDGGVTLTYRLPDGSAGSYGVVAETARLVPAPPCGAPPEAAAAVEPEWRLVGFSIIQEQKGSST